VSHARCKTCGAEIIWAETPAGRAIPLDVEPVYGKQRSFWEKEAEPTLVPRGAMVLLPGQKTRAATEEDLKLKRPMYVSHFSTCPDHDMHRRVR